MRSADSRSAGDIFHSLNLVSFSASKLERRGSAAVQLRDVHTHGREGKGRTGEVSKYPHVCQVLGPVQGCYNNKLIMGKQECDPSVIVHFLGFLDYFFKMSVNGYKTQVREGGENPKRSHSTAAGLAGARARRTSVLSEAHDGDRVPRAGGGRAPGIPTPRKDICTQVSLYPRHSTYWTAETESSRRTLKHFRLTGSWLILHVIPSYSPHPPAVLIDTIRRDTV